MEALELSCGVEFVIICVRVGVCTRVWSGPKLQFYEMFSKFLTKKKLQVGTIEF